MKVLTKATNGTKSVSSGASVELLAENSRRSFAMISNPQVVGMWVSLGSAAVIGTGIYVPPNGGAFIISEEGGLWRGSVNGIMSTGGAVAIGTVELQ